MSERVDKFCNDLRDKLNTVEERLDRVKSSLQTASDETREAVDAKKLEIETAWEAQQQKIADAKAKAERQMEEKKSETVAKIEEWKTNREIHKLEKRAERDEDYAVTAIYIAAAAVEEAEIAMLDALGSRMIADEAEAQAVQA